MDPGDAGEHVLILEDGCCNAQLGIQLVQVSNEFEQRIVLVFSGTAEAAFTVITLSRVVHAESFAGP
ncbi:MAG: hypothetical protein RAK24_03505 [TACK group archaeon]|nr:hypothetical protein [TACK group archaeon]